MCSPVCRVPLHFHDHFLCYADKSKCDVVHVIFFNCSLSFFFFLKQELIAKANVKELLVVFCHRSFIVSDLNFKSFIHFELVFLLCRKISLQFYSFDYRKTIFSSTAS